MVDINPLISNFSVVLANALDRILFTANAGTFRQAKGGTRLRSSAEAG